MLRNKLRIFGWMIDDCINLVLYG
jgi:hypothetical protein